VVSAVVITSWRPEIAILIPHLRNLRSLALNADTLHTAEVFFRSSPSIKKFEVLEARERLKNQISPNFDFFSLTLPHSLEYVFI
jgi:hypothetical protein